MSMYNYADETVHFQRRKCSTSAVAGVQLGCYIHGNYFIEDTAEFTAYVPRINKLFAESLAVVPLQLVGYYVTIAKGFDVDKPRNLAKSVTVE